MNPGGLDATGIAATTLRADEVRALPESDLLTATVGISKGDGVAYLLSQYNNVSNLENASSLEFYTPTPLPEGLTLEPNGRISGTPTEFGEFAPRVRVTDSLDRTDEQEVTLIIHEEGEPPCPWDHNGDDLVNPLDVNRVKDHYGCDVADPDCAAHDHNGDGVVNPLDVNRVKDHYGPCP